MSDLKKVVVEIFFDYSSPWTYLGFEGILKLRRQYDWLEVIWRPILVGGVFNSVNPSVYQQRQNPPPKPKLVYSLNDLQEWSDSYGLKIRGPFGGNPPEVFPVNSAKALRGAFYALEKDEATFLKYSKAVFHTYWELGKDISNNDILKNIVKGIDKLDPEEFMKYIEQDQPKKKN